VVDLLPDIEVVEDDAFNSDPTDPKYMGPDVLQRFRRGEQLKTAIIRTPLVSFRDTCVRAHSHTHTHMHKHTHTLTHTHVHKHTHKHTRATQTHCMLTRVPFLI
jgi:hypothetical protein